MPILHGFPWKNRSIISKHGPSGQQTEHFYTVTDPLGESSERAKFRGTNASKEETIASWPGPCHAHLLLADLFQCSGSLLVLAQQSQAPNLLGLRTVLTRGCGLSLANGVGDFVGTVGLVRLSAMLSIFETNSMISILAS